MTDPNRNRSQVAFDALGLVVGTAVMGKPEENLGDSLDGFEPDLTEAVIARPPDESAGRSARPSSGAPPRGSSTTSSLISARKSQPDPQPAVVYTLARETHVADLVPGEEVQDPAQLLLLRRLRPRDPEEDPGRAGATRSMAGGAGCVAPALGRQRLDHLQQQGQARPPVRAVLQRHPPLRVRRSGRRQPVLFYDPVGRVVATLHPNHTYEKVVFDPWRQVTWDVNDTVAGRPQDRPDVSDYLDV